MTTRIYFSALLIAALGACADTRRVPLTGPQESPAFSATIGVSDLHPKVGETVVMTVHVETLGHVHPPASFVADVDYDSTALVFMKEVPMPGAMRALNRHQGRLIAAGATTAGFSDGRLFAAAFRVINSAGLNTVRLSIRELTDTGFHSTLHRLAIDQSLHLERTQE